MKINEKNISGINFDDPTVKIKIIEKIIAHQKRFPSFSHGYDYLLWVSNLSLIDQLNEINRPISQWTRNAKGTKRRAFRLRNY